MLYEATTIEFTLGGINYVGDLPDMVASKHITMPMRNAGLPTAAYMSLSSAALGLVFATAVRVGKAKKKTSSAPYGDLRQHGFCPFTFGDAVERHFTVGENVGLEEFFTAARRCMSAVMGFDPDAVKVDDADDDEQPTPVIESGDEALGNSERIPTSDSESISESATGSDPSTT